MRTAVVGHVEWVDFARVERVPSPGEIVTAERDWALPAGGGAVAAVQLARLAGECTFLTALGDDELGERSRRELEQLGVRVEAAIRAGKPTRRAFTFLDASAERTITVLGERLHPERGDALPWDELAEVDALYFTAGDTGALAAARAARVLVATARAMDVIAAGGVELDAIVRSGRDPSEQYRGYEPRPRFVVTTAGAGGGRWESADGRTGEWAAAALPGPPADSYGCGDSFAAGLAFGLARDGELPAALELAARCGAVCLTGEGPYEQQLTLA
ncbi:MAG: ribokinase [Actinobacteria bacterium]|nr:MAG: ribokinase [Actinomycetota bacterium]TMM09367.1 MAG: ribokinase [Actinomycetota bacterium]